jgi:uncharacterized RDD family membrane protein YckC
VHFASRSSRLLGQLLDGLVAFSPMLLVVVLDVVGLSSGFLGMAALLFSVAYYFLADGLPGGQSLGKRMLGMTVVHGETGAPCTVWQSFVRNLLLALLGPLDWVFIFGNQHQRLGDKAARTVVVEAA